MSIPAATQRPNSPHHNPLLNIDRDMENQAARRRTQQHRQNLNVNPRDRLFHALFMKIGHLYLRVVPKNFRLLLEIMVLLKAIFLFSVLTYLHFSFGRMPLNCLNTTEGSWPRDGVLRVQIQPKVSLKHQIPRFFSSEENRVLFHPCHDENSPFTEQQCAELSTDMHAYYTYHSEKYSLLSQCYRMNLSDFLMQENFGDWKLFENFEYIMTDKRGRTFKGFRPGDIIQEASLLTFYNLYLAFSEPERHYIFEYAKEFGFLRLSPETRKRLKIPVKIVNLDPNKEKCLGDRMSRFILKYFLGYDDIIMNSIKKISDADNNTGFMLNVMTGEHYKFVPWGIGRSSYFISLLLMFLFTISISTLLRYCHQQVFFFIIHVLRMMDMNVVLAFPIAPLFTVILSLVGMETIMSEYFNDTTISFYIILIVWAVDQFDSICCHTTTSQKYWLRFFYLYHFIFYAYHYRFNGQYSSLALAATWFLIQHSMLYFFHNYELPSIEDQMHGRRDEEAYLDEAVQMIVEGIEMVAGQNHQDNAENQPNNAEGGAQGETNNGTGANGGTGNSPQGVVTEDGQRVREISTNENGNRVFVFSGEGQFVQMVRDFIHQVHERVNVGVTGNTEQPETLNNATEGAESSENTGTASVSVPENPRVENDNEFHYGPTQIRPELDVRVRSVADGDDFSAFVETVSSATQVDSRGTASEDGSVRQHTTPEIHAEQIYQQVQSLQHNLGQIKMQSRQTNTNIEKNKDPKNEKELWTKKEPNLMGQSTSCPTNQTTINSEHELVSVNRTLNDTAEHVLLDSERTFETNSISTFDSSES
ncbi:membralin-like [Clytia hemisphaerica]|uniref:Membralin n=1 Tax=Clytia hemisphaerica TaxID=252671 RepID=A0A7M5UWD1_9CNID